MMRFCIKTTLLWVLLLLTAGCSGVADRVSLVSIDGLRVNLIKQQVTAELTLQNAWRKPITVTEAVFNINDKTLLLTLDQPITINRRSQTGVTAPFNFKINLAEIKNLTKGDVNLDITLKFRMGQGRMNTIRRNLPVSQNQVKQLLQSMQNIKLPL